MKNSKNKIIAALCCGVVIGSIGTSLSGIFQRNNIIQGDTFQGNLNKKEDSRKTSDFKNKDGKRGKHHKGEVSLDDNTNPVDVSSGEYKDGTYEGTSPGYASGLKVQVKIDSGKITSIDVVSHNETPGFYEKAFEKVPEEIIQKQSTDVDTASGATYSSKGIINAVNNALNSAKVS
ncbi:FMN-binding protein [Clostridium perfringens]|uniref:FMN-binding protein n=1 Tax=Clostridium perfringens TaxID=1502 RepID=UPI00224650DC|nr:FMN-binding protein [Clostridium perfringens]EJT6665688.1 FMN-binding protein [Clostridium perfringens]ELC8454671.1 FMN-binding protein [Clostridium perfringens]MCX0360145.1 FMN-binding protein [Clostridium perfringens]MCX0365050.1 FMN-binding protein [Clostridium perfringens]MCX0374745.1 FMN-binding protein [Clostridium perfringens]